jgi:hypothetical protein
MSHRVIREIFPLTAITLSRKSRLQADGTESPIQRYKDAVFRLKRQAARFRIFEFDTPESQGSPAQFPAGTTVQWTVKLANKKDAVFREAGPQVERPDSPIVPQLPRL